jgi:hypothetical protein
VTYLVWSRALFGELLPHLDVRQLRGASALSVLRARLAGLQGVLLKKVTKYIRFRAVVFLFLFRFFFFFFLAWK